MQNGFARKLLAAIVTLNLYSRPASSHAHLRRKGVSDEIAHVLSWHLKQPPVILVPCVILFCNFSGFPWYCFDMRSCSLRVQPPTARICRVKYSLSSGAELMVNGCHSFGPKEEKWVIGYSLSEQHILTPINPKYNDRFCQILRRLTHLFLKFKNIVALKSPPLSNEWLLFHVKFFK